MIPNGHIVTHLSRPGDGRVDGRTALAEDDKASRVELSWLPFRPAGSERKAPQAKRVGRGSKMVHVR
jgi:hypothetical protein